MQVITTLTQKGQVTLPKNFRQMLGMASYDRVLVETAEDHIKIRPMEDILDLAGAFKTTRKKSLLKARETFEKGYQRI